MRHLLARADATTMFASVREDRFSTVSPDITSLTGEPPQSYAGFLRSAGLG